MKSQDFEQMNRTEIIDFVLDVNNRLLSLAVKNKKLKEDVIAVNNKINQLYNDDDEVFIKQIELMMQPLVKISEDLNYSLSNFNEVIEDEEENIFLEGYVRYGRQVLDEVNEFENIVLKDILDSSEKLKLVNEKIKDYDREKQKKFKLLSEGQEEELEVFVEDFLLTDMFFANTQ